ncbi:MAG: peptidase C69 [Acidobacteria bacterium]|nr:MAG: peptidase C69 [Acidobacteriota bacterium]
MSELAEIQRRDLADVALNTAVGGGAAYADFRLEKHRRQGIEVKERDVERLQDSSSKGYAVRLVRNGRWGFAASDDITPDGVARTATRALAMASALEELKGYDVALADEPPVTGRWSSPLQIDPFEIDVDEKIAHLIEVNRAVLAGKVAKYCNSWLDQAKELKYLVTSEGTEVAQERTRLQSNFEAVATGSDGRLVELRSDSVPAGRGYEHIRDFDFLAAAERHSELLAEKLAAPSVTAGKYDLVVGATNLWLTIHESIGHATELDRVLGYEANYAGTSFATLENLDQLKYGSDAVTVLADRTQEGGLSTVAWDDDGVAAQEWPLISEGILVGYQYNREIAAAEGLPRSVGCAYADSWQHMPIQRMPNVSLQPSADDTSIEDLVSGVEDGIYITGDNSWSIDMRRLNFQFTGQLYYQIKNGKIAGMLRDVAYQGNTIDFWNSCEAVGGPDTYVLGGAFNCGKGQPGQVAAVSHGAPAALFRQVNVLNTSEKG